MRTLPRDEPPSAVTVSSGGHAHASATSARVHVVEPHGFNDAQEVGDRLKANQPVIINLQGVPASSSGASSTSRAGSPTPSAARCSASPTRSSCSRRATSRSPRRRRSGCRPAGCTTPELVHERSSVRVHHRLHRHPRSCGRCCRGSRSARDGAGPGQRDPASTSPSRSLRPLRRIIPPVGMFDVSFLVLFFGLIIILR